MSDEPNIVSIRECLVVKPRTFEQLSCKHMRVLLDDTRRVVECEDCGVIMEAYDYLRSYGNRVLGHWERLGRNANDMVDHLTAEIQELERRKRSLRTSVRRAEKMSKEQVAP